MKFTTRIGVTIASLLITSSANVVLGRDLPSPDSTLMATISAVGGAKGESQLEIRLLTGEILIKKSYASEDGQHGEIVDQVEWTPDSQFLVYSMYSSGGHQPWHSPIDFYSRKQNAVINLEARVALIADPEFHVIGPGVIELFGKDTGAEAENSWFRVDLREQR